MLVCAIAPFFSRYGSPELNRYAQFSAGFAQFQADIMVSFHLINCSWGIILNLSQHIESVCSSELKEKTKEEKQKQNPNRTLNSKMITLNQISHQTLVVNRVTIIFFITPYK